MLTNLSDKNRTRRKEISPKVIEQRHLYANLATTALLRVYPSIPNFGVELAFIDAEDKLELFWQITNLGGDAPGNWHQVHNLALEFKRESDDQIQTKLLTSHTAGFYAWYRMRGGMISILPTSSYFNLEAGTWSITVTGDLQDAQPLCLFADSFADLFHYEPIQDAYDRIAKEFKDRHHAADTPAAPIEPFRIYAGKLVVASDKTAPIQNMQANRLHHVAVRYSDVKDLPVPKVDVPPSTPLDPINYFHAKLHYLHEQSLKYDFCPYSTVNYWNNPPAYSQAHFTVTERACYFHIEALAPLYRVTGNPEIYRTARKWYENIARNIWPKPGGGETITCADRTVFGSALAMGGMCDGMCTFAEIDGQSKWVEPFRAGLLSWPMHPIIPRPLMDQDAWGYEEMNTTGTYNMVNHFAVANWRVGDLLNDAALKARAEHIINEYTFRGDLGGYWSYRPGNFPSHHYDMYTKWQLARLLFTGSPRWTKDKEFLARMRRATDYTISNYATEVDGELRFIDWTHNKNVTHPANAARQAAAQLEVLLAMVMYVDEGYLEPLTKGLKHVYKLLNLPEVDNCWRGSWFHLHGNLLALALNGFHVEGKTVDEMKIVRMK